MDRLDRYHWMTEGAQNPGCRRPYLEKSKKVWFDLFPQDFSGRRGGGAAADKLQLFAPPSTFHLHSSNPTISLLLQNIYALQLWVDKCGEL